jgi:hypothetical protein
MGGHWKEFLPSVFITVLTMQAISSSFDGLKSSSSRIEILGRGNFPRFITRLP